MNTSTTTLPRVRAAAREAFAAADLDAVLLFGSRARGDAGERSDWDVAPVGRHARRKLKRIEKAFAHLDNVQLVPLTARSIERHRNHALRLESNIAREAKVLAGAWRPPETLSEELTVTEDVLRWQLDKIRGAVEDVMASCCTNVTRGAEYDPGLVVRSHAAAEAVAKTIVASFGKPAKSTHNLAVLAECLREPQTTPHPLEDGRRRFADDIAALNGTKDLHTAGYVMKPLEAAERTRKRVEDTLGLHTRWLTMYARHDTVARKVVAGQEPEINIVERHVTTNDEFSDIAPASLREGFRQWGNEQRALARRCAGELTAVPAHGRPGNGRQMTRRGKIGDRRRK